ncbi:predicted protein [Plenodomus lingam JN3]|uniref:Predicted protein n=1 Tax=Leptosphaeria maculans (strain JN3 / isolate v23.1.3 / race Av1-4-5-6-7-8) TaxID=985895 RepID=E4ZMF5_LEPMJ|nr:predicted protein [Plenodomus lingam JN3]CBX92504.1 predicted protein [Plenodomus lingam JN3]
MNGELKFHLQTSSTVRIVQNSVTVVYGHNDLPIRRMGNVSLVQAYQVEKQYSSPWLPSASAHLAKDSKMPSSHLTLYVSTSTLGSEGAGDGPEELAWGDPSSWLEPAFGWQPDAEYRVFARLVRILGWC